ncbi:MAG: hypothetical protein P4L40_19005 [Terracidiphilus sp.]|nr:hypothetical protein [Terracidiphilus sp.]
MATNVFISSQAGAGHADPLYSLAETNGGQRFRLRREQGFVSCGGELHVETRSGLAGVRGVAMAFVLEVAAMGCVWMAWHWLR